MSGFGTFFMTSTHDITVVGYGGHRGRLVHQTIAPHKRRSVYDWLSEQSRRFEDQICNNQSPVVFHEHNVREPDIGGVRGHFYGAVSS